MKARRIAGPLLLLLTIASFGMWVHGAVPDVPTGQWLPGPALAQPREGAVSVALDDGRVLVIGGRTASGPVSTVEVFNANGSLAVGAHLLSRRAGHTATKLPDGSVLVVGGRTLVTTDDGSGPVTAEMVTNSAEVFDVNAGVWYPAASLSIVRSGHTATAVADGHVVVAGGVGTDGAALDSFEVFDPESGVFSSPGLLSAARTEHAAAAAGATKVLVAGGRSGNGVSNTADVIDVVGGSISTVVLTAARAGASATALLDGKILVAGGSDGVNDLASAEVVDSATGVSAPTASMAQPRRDHNALLLANNNAVLIAGGTNGGAVASSAEKFIPWTGEFLITGSPASARTSAVLSNVSKEGVAWFTAGRSDSTRVTASELYGFATLKTDKDDYPPGTTVYMTGSGWQPGERVVLVLHEIGTGHADRTYYADADTAGRIANAQFATDVSHLGVRFHVTARGAASEAQVTFTDAKGTDTALVSSLNPSGSGQQVTFTATVTETNGGGGTPGAVVTIGSVIFREGGNNCNQGTVIAGPLSLDSAGQATAAKAFTVTAQADFTIRACYTGAGTGSSGTGNSFSEALIQTVNACSAPTVTTHPTPQSVTYGENASFQAAASGTPTPTVQWEVSTDNGANWNNLAGATSTTLSLTQPTVAMSGNRYRAVFTNTCSGTKTATTSAATLTVAKATATVTLSNLTQTYTGSPLTPTATTNPAGLDITWTGAPQTNAGSYPVTATVNDVNYQGSSTPGTFVVNTASSTTTVTCGAGPFTYLGAAITPCSATVTGAGSLNQSLTVTYSNNVNAGVASAGASFAGDANHDPSSDSKTFTIDKAASTTSITCPTNVTYTGSPLTPCSATATGAGELNESVAVTYTNNINAGAATADASFGGDANHTNSTATQAGFTIDKAASTTSITCPTNVTFTGSPLTPCSATATGAGGLNESVAVTYTNNINAGAATADASFGGDANHINSTATQAGFTIDKAASTTSITCPANVTYTGLALTPCMATATGAGGLNESVAVTYTNNINAGVATADASFGGDANHINSTATQAGFTIDKAASTTSITCPTNVTYTGLALTPCMATVAGVGGLNQPVDVTYLDNTNPGTGTANATYSGDTNHQVSSDTETFSITYGLCSAAVGAGGVILQPINSDGTSVFARKGGSTLPVKFRVCDASGNPIANPAAVFAGTGGSLTMLSAVRGTVDIVNEPGVMEIPDAGFRFSGNQWVFNMATSNLAQGTTYTFRINLASGSILFRAGIK